MMIDAVKLAQNELIKQQGFPLDKHQRFYFDISELVGPLEEFCSKPGQRREIPGRTDGIMPLVFWSMENVTFFKDALLFSMQHQYLQNGDIMVDPRMELFCFPEHHVVIASPAAKRVGSIRADNIECVCRRSGCRIQLCQGHWNLTTL